MKKTLQNMVAKGLIIAGLTVPGLAFAGAVTSLATDSINGVARPSIQLSRYYDLQSQLDKKPVNEFGQRTYPILKEEFQALQTDNLIMKEKEIYESRKVKDIGFYCGAVFLTSLLPGLYMASKGIKKSSKLKEE